MTTERVIEHIDAHRETYVEQLLELLRIPSISAQPDHADDIAEAAEWVRRRLAEAGLDAETLPTAGHPVVFADSGPVGDGPTVLVYGHYDVQPIGEAAKWHSPAFRPEVRDGVVYARGAADDKGQMMTHVCAAAAWHIVANRPPVRLKFLIEGEEETGSPHLGAFVHEQRNRLTCDCVAISDTAKLDADTPAITYGTKGLVYKEVRLFGPSKDLHSGSFGGSVANPATVLTKLVAALKDDGDRVTIPDFYDDVFDLTAEERELMNNLPFDEAAYLEQLGAPALYGEAGYAALERRWSRPTLDVNGLYGGYAGDGAATIIPASAGVKVSMRLVPRQDPERISAAFDAFLRERCPDAIHMEITTHGVAAAYVTPLDSPEMRAGVRAIQAGFGREPVFLREGGTLPILPLFKSELDADSVLLGFCRPDCNLHSPNEFFHLDDFHAGIRTVAHFLGMLAAR